MILLEFSGLIEPKHFDREKHHRHNCRRGKPHMRLKIDLQNLFDESTTIGHFYRIIQYPRIDHHTQLLFRTLKVLSCTLSLF